MTSLRRTLLVLGLSTAFGLGIPQVGAMAQHGQHEGNSSMKMDVAEGPVTLTGEVLDLYCFMKHPDNGQGPGHAKCAMNCIRKGLPIGFLSDGEVYLIIGKDHESAKDMVVDFAGSQAVLKGTLVNHHGVRAIEIASIEKAE